MTNLNLQGIKIFLNCFYLLSLVIFFSYLPSVCLILHVSSPCTSFPEEKSFQVVRSIETIQKPLGLKLYVKDATLLNVVKVSVSCSR
jgi:hypothetical protein